jgi:hypothetical protein
MNDKMLNLKSVKSEKAILSNKGVRCQKFKL